MTCKPKEAPEPEFDPSEDAPDPSESAFKARASARRAAFNHESKAKAIMRIRKQWPEVAGEAPCIVDEAYAWYARRRPGTLITVDGIEKRVTSLDSLNKRFARLEVPDNPACIILRDEARPIHKEEFAFRVSEEVVCIGINDKGEPRWKEASKVWVESATKHVYRDITFTNKPVSDDTMNLFRCFGVEARKGDCSLIKQHIREVVCAGDDRNYEAFIDLVAWQVQNIGKPSRVIVALITEEQQTGKGTLLEEVLAKIFGAACHTAKQIAEITGDFNAILRGKAYVFLDEALFRGDKKAANVVKGLVASQHISLNEKFLPRVSVPAGINIWIASNDLVPVHVEEHDARYWALWGSPHRRIDHRLSKEENAPNIEYWLALYAELDNGGREAFLHEMLQRDISGFVPQRDIPRKNEAHATLVRGGLNEGDPRFWLEESLESGILIYVPAPGTTYDEMLATPVDDIDLMQRWEAGKEVKAAALVPGYRAWVSKQRGYGIKTARTDEFWQILTACGFAVRRTKHGNLRVIPDPEECRHFIKMLFYGE